MNEENIQLKKNTGEFFLSEITMQIIFTFYGVFWRINPNYTAIIVVKFCQ